MMNAAFTVILRFLGVGAVNTGLTFLLYQALLFLFPYPIAFSISFAASVAFGAYMNSRMVFRSSLTIPSAGRFLAVCLVNYGLSVLLVTSLIEKVGVHERIAPVLAVAVMLPLS